jgi:hypothetical protein
MILREKRRRRGEEEEDREWLAKMGFAPLKSERCHLGTLE